MHKRTRRTLLVVAGVVLLLALAVFLRSKAPPEAARLLPESDGILYFNLKPVRAFIHKDLKPPRRVPEYQQFVDATGIDWERDLDSAAIALHRMPDPNGPNGPVAYSMVLTGKLTGKRLNTWLDANASSREVYAGHTIYSVPSENRTVRVVQIGYDMIAVSNTPTAEQIHSIVDRHRTAALPFAGSTLLSRHFHDVPLLSVAWGVGQIGLPFSESGAIKVLGLLPAAPGRLHHHRQHHARPPPRQLRSSPGGRDRPQRGQSRQPGRLAGHHRDPGPQRHHPARRQFRQQRPPRIVENRRSHAETQSGHRHRQPVPGVFQSDYEEREFFRNPSNPSCAGRITMSDVLLHPASRKRVLCCLKGRR